MSEGWKQRLAGGGRRALDWARADPPRVLALALGLFVLVYGVHWFFDSKHPRGSTAEPSTDGRYYYLLNIARLKEQLTARVEEKTKYKEVPSWDAPRPFGYLFVVFVSFLSVEWILRKRWQLL